MRPFEEELKVLKSKLQDMGSLVAGSVHKSVQALVEKNGDFAHQVLRDESRINQLEVQIDDLATTLIAREQPVARDMRLVVTAIKINGELERMGDLAALVAERALSLERVPQLKCAANLEKIGSMVQQMVLQALDAFVTEDADKATSILASDNEVDAVRNEISHEIVVAMAATSDVEAVQRDLDILIAARNLERIADHTTNIAEEIIFLVHGVDVRHSSMREPGNAS